tara:strand:- start:915 stop:1214 length:300 start_codon:yes stop_codon:yes gene_type:complete
MNGIIVKTIASGITSTLLTSMVATWYLIQEYLGESMAMQLMIPAYGWSLLTLWGDEIKDVMSGNKTVEEVVEEVVGDNVELEQTWDFISKQLPRYNKED